MQRRSFLQLAPAALAARAAAPARRSNFLFIYADDRRYGAMRALGQPYELPYEELGSI